MSKPLPPITVTDLKALLDAGEKPRMIDVREQAEWVSPLGHIDGAELVPLGTLQAQLAKISGEEREIVCICKSGMRSGQAADFLAKNGLKVRSLHGGMMAWNAAGFAVSTS